MLKKNAGFSLIELIVTIAIMSILCAGVVTTVLSRSNWGIKKASKEISAALSETRVQALAKENACMEISYEEDKGGYVISTSYCGDVVLGKDITISYKQEGTNNSVDVKDKPLILSYERASGAFLPMIDPDFMTRAKDGTGLATVDTVKGDNGNDIRITYYTYLPGNVHCEKITISAVKHHGYELTLHWETGKHELKKY